MNYYKHHIGDYAGATEHLSWDEDMAYSRLLRVYYRDERAIPADLPRTYRLVRASTPAQRRAVDSVLKEFFTLADDGWHQKRCDDELAAAHEKSEANRERGKLGGRPKKIETREVQNEKPNNNPDGFETETRWVNSGNPTKTQATSHKPLATSQEVAATPDSLEAVGHRACEVAGIDPGQIAVDFVEVQRWQAAGYDLERDIVPAIKGVASRPGYQPARSLRYFTRAIAEANQRRLSPPPERQNGRPWEGYGPGVPKSTNIVTGSIEDIDEREELGLLTAAEAEEERVMIRAKRAAR